MLFGKLANVMVQKFGVTLKSRVDVLGQGHNTRRM